MTDVYILNIITTLHYIQAQAAIYKLMQTNVISFEVSCATVHTVQHLY